MDEVQMVRFDKITFVTPLTNVMIKENENWETIIKNGTIVRMRFMQKVPYLITLDANYQDGEFKVEFTGRILKDDYPLLINRLTIRKCLTAINQIGVCILNVERVLADSTVLRCDVTRDLSAVNLSDFRKHVVTHIDNHRKWICRSFTGNENIVIEKDVTTQRNKRRMSIYNKTEELLKRNNDPFMHWVNTNEIKRYFQGVTRFELSLSTCSAIRQELDVQDCDLITVLNSNANPICDFFENVLRDATPTVPGVNSMKTYDKLNTLIVNNWDLNAIEKTIRQLYPKSYHSSYLDDYRRLIDAHQNSTASNKYDFSQLFDDNSMDQTTVTEVDDNYWKKHTEVSSWELGNSDISKIGDYRFITDCPCTEPEHVC